MTYHVPKCLQCGQKEVTIVLDSTGAGFCSSRCRDVVLYEMALYDRDYHENVVARYRNAGAL